MDLTDGRESHCEVSFLMVRAFDWDVIQGPMNGALRWEFGGCS
jgi:hypothetical protein